jgi:hypothetical protein
MLTLKKTIITIILFSVVFSPLGSVIAQTDSSSSAFNPNYIISDAEIQDWQSMSQDDIHAA